MTNWLHLVGQQYGQDKFIKESERIGIQRAVQTSMLNSMAWGDVIYVGVTQNTRRGQKIKKKIVVFGYFKISTISVVRTERTKDILDNLQQTHELEERLLVERQCGVYALVRMSTTNLQLSDFYNAFKNIKGAKILIGAPAGSFIPIIPLALKDAIFFRGYRRVQNLSEIAEQEFDRYLYELEDYSLR